MLWYEAGKEQETRVSITRRAGRSASVTGHPLDALGNGVLRYGP